MTNRLKEILNEKGLTQAYLAWRTGYPECAVSKWCTGTRTPTIKTALKIAKVLGVSVEYIWGDLEDDSRVTLATDGAAFYELQAIELSNEQAEKLHELIFKGSKIEA